MIYSICIKSNNNTILNYLLKQFEQISVFPIFLSSYKFKKYKNVIIHYKGDCSNFFYCEVSKILAQCTFEFFEQKIIKNIINSNYFYFSEPEKNKILAICSSLLSESNYQFRICIIQKAYLNYIILNKSIVLDGFINFRIKEYTKILDEIVDIGVNKFIVEREYEEFIGLLKIYISSKTSSINFLHLIYSNEESILIDENSNIINTDNSAFLAKYLSDISFSSNDYTLNTLLNLLPQKIYIHLINNEDEFINTLKLIFEERISICTDCAICRAYNSFNTSNK